MTWSLNGGVFGNSGGGGGGGVSQADIRAVLRDATIDQLPAIFGHRTAMSEAMGARAASVSGAMYGQSGQNVFTWTANAAGLAGNAIQIRFAATNDVNLSWKVENKGDAGAHLWRVYIVQGAAIDISDFVESVNAPEYVVPAQAGTFPVTLAITEPPNNLLDGTSNLNQVTLQLSGGASAIPAGIVNVPLSAGEVMKVNDAGTGLVNQPVEQWETIRKANIHFLANNAAVDTGGGILPGIWKNIRFGFSDVHQSATVAGGPAGWEYLNILAWMALAETAVGNIDTRNHRLNVAFRVLSVNEHEVLQVARGPGNAFLIAVTDHNVNFPEFTLEGLRA